MGQQPGGILLLLVWLSVSVRGSLAFRPPTPVRPFPTRCSVASNDNNDSAERSTTAATSTASVVSDKRHPDDNNNDIDDDEVPSDAMELGLDAKQLALLEEEQQKFLATCKVLCEQRNFPLEKVKNARDLSSVQNSPVQRNRILRMGRVSDASQDDIQLLFHQLNITTLIDTRSPTELKDDTTLLREQVFGNFTNMMWQEQGRGRDGCVKELEPGQQPVRPRSLKRFWEKDQGVAAATTAISETEISPSVSTEIIAQEHLEAELEISAEEDVCGLDCDEDDPETMQESTVLRTYQGNRKERHFVSLMNEFKYVKGTVGKLRKRDLAKAALRSPSAIFSKKARTAVKKPFLDEINDGGLPMLNELLLRFGAPGIKYVLELCADRTRHPVAFYCTAGKDRTGMLTAIILALCGTKAEDIVEDYSLSANVYAEMNDHQAMVGALSQRSLDPKTFLGAPPQVMRDTLLAIEENYGSVEGYCTWIGFGPEKQQKLIQACTQPDDEE
jgi:hypothetical protein